MRVAVLWCPDWPVIAAGFNNHDSVAIMFANRVVACSENARKYGIKRGLRQREAQACCPDVKLLPLNQAQQAETFEPVVDLVEQIAVGVQVVRPGVCAVATKGPSRYFGGDKGLADEIKIRIQNIRIQNTGRFQAIGQKNGQAAGYECHVGIADGLFAASCAARHDHIVPGGTSAQYLSELPVSTLEQPQLADLLSRLGLKTLGAFASLSPKDVLNRFGNEGLKAHRLANGKDDHVLIGRDIPEEFNVQIQIDPPAQQVDRASFAAKRAADQLVEHLDTKALACRLIRIEVETEHGESRHRHWRHDIGFTASAIADRVRWQLAGWLNAVGETGRPSAGVSLLRLIPEEIVPANGRQNEFWGGESFADIRAGRAIDRVRGLLGADAVFKAKLSGGRSAGEQFCLVPWGDNETPALDPAQPWPGKMPAPAPTIIHRPPQPAQVLTNDGTSVLITKRGVLKQGPASIVVRGEQSVITAWAGPWLYDERWWDPVAAKRRACFQFVTTDGKAVLAAFESGAWFIEATYD